MTYLLRRLIATIPVAFFVAVFAFILVHLAPGDASAFLIHPDSPPAVREQLRANLGLDQPLPVQFTLWLGNVVKGDFGTSFITGQPVLEMFWRRFPPSAYLLIASLIVALILAIPIGVLSAIKQNSLIDKFATVFVLIGLAMPNFWFGLLLVLLFSVNLGWLPTQGFVRPEESLIGSIRHLVLPAIALGYSGAALIARMTRSSMLEVLRQDYIRTARSKGVRLNTINYKHALSNAFNPILTVIGLTLVSLISGNIVVEMVFNFPGIGRLIIDAVLRRDYPVLQGTLLIIALFTIVINLIVDLLYVVIDPRIRYD